MKARINEILESFRDFVASHEEDGRKILTAYVNTDPSNPNNQRQDRPAWLIELENETKQLEATLDQEKLKRRDTQRKWQDTEEMVMQYLRHRRSTGPSVVLFTDHEDFLAVDLPVVVPTRVYYGLPQLEHLLFNLDQYKKYLVILLSGDEVRMLEVYLTRTTQEIEIDTEQDLARRMGRKAETHKRYRREEEYEQRFVREVATAVNESLLGDPDFERIVLGGNQKQAHALKNALHPSVRERLVGIESIPFKAPESEIAETVKALADRFEPEHDLSVVEDLVSRFNRSGAAALEHQRVKEALSAGNVRRLVIPYPSESDELDQMIVDATLAGAEIEFVVGEAASKLEQLGGIGALLYYSPS